MNAIRAAIARLLARYRRRPATPTRADGAWSRLEQSVERDPIAAWGGSVPRRPYREQPSIDASARLRELGADHVRNQLRDHVDGWGMASGRTGWRGSGEVRRRR